MQNAEILLTQHPNQGITLRAYLHNFALMTGADCGKPTKWLICIWELASDRGPSGLNPYCPGR